MKLQNVISTLEFTLHGGTYKNVTCDVNVRIKITKKVSEYDQEIPQLQTADNPVAPRGRAAQTSQDTRKTN